MFHNSGKTNKKIIKIQRVTFINPKVSLPELVHVLNLFFIIPLTLEWQVGKSKSNGTSLSPILSIMWKFQYTNPILLKVIKVQHMKNIKFPIYHIYFIYDMGNFLFDMGNFIYDMGMISVLRYSSLYWHRLYPQWMH